MAAVLACGPGALVSHRSAALLLDLLPSARRRVDVTTLRGRCADREGIDVHRVRRLHPDDRAKIDGIPVTSLARTLLDLAEVIPQRRLVYVIRAGGANWIAGSPRAEGADGAQPRAARPLEARARVPRLLPRAPAPRPGPQCSSLRSDCRRALVKQRLIVEIDSWGHRR
jgi:hypothetical protein